MPVAIPHTQLAEVLRVLQEAAGETGPSVRVARRDLQSDFEALGNRDPPYGKLVTSIDLGIAEARAVPIVNPFALLYWMCQESRLGDLLPRGREARIAIYSDDTKTGQCLAA